MQTLQGPGGTAIYDMSCLNLNYEISFGESWYVVPYMVNDILAGGVDVDGMTPRAVRGGRVAVQPVQQPRLPMAAPRPAEFSTQSGTSWTPPHPRCRLRTLPPVAGLQAEAVAGSEPSSYYAGDIVFVPDLDNTTAGRNGEPRLFMTDPVPPGNDAPAKQRGSVDRPDCWPDGDRVPPIAPVQVEPAISLLNSDFNLSSSFRFDHEPAPVTRRGLIVWRGTRWGWPSCAPAPPLQVCRCARMRNGLGHR